MNHLTQKELEAGMVDVRRSPTDAGPLKLIVCRPRPDAREILPEGTLDPAVGLVGDDWQTRGGTRSPADPDKQITIMNARFIALIARRISRWALAGDQLYLDLDLSADNLPPGTRLELGSAILEVTAPPHTGCQKFVDRFGPDAARLANSDLGRKLNLRGIHARVVQAGTTRVGDLARKVKKGL